MGTVIDTHGDPRHLVLNGKPDQGKVRAVTDRDGKWAFPVTRYGAATKAIATAINGNFFTADGKRGKRSIAACSLGTPTDS